MKQYNAATSSPDILRAIAGITSVILVTLILLATSGRQREMKPRKVPKVKGQRRRGRS